MYLKRVPDNNNWNISTAYINLKKCFETFGSEFSKIYLEYAVPFSPESVTHRHHTNDNLILELALGFCRANQIPSLGVALQNPDEGNLFFSMEELEGSIPKATGYYEKPERLSSKVLLREISKEVFLEYSNQNITCSTGSLELSKNFHHVVIGKIYSIEESKIILHPLVMGPPIEGISYFNYLPKFLQNKDYSILEKLTKIETEINEIKSSQFESSTILKSIKVEMNEFQFLFEKLREDFNETTNRIFTEIEFFENQKLEQEWNNYLFQEEVRELLLGLKKLNFSENENGKIQKELNDSDVSVKHKLKLVIPLFLVRYESEIEIGNKQRLPKNWKEWKNLFFENKLL